MDDEGSQPVFVDGEDDVEKENDGSAKSDDGARKKSNRGRRSAHGIEYPEDNICPFCKKGTSKPNWARHLTLLHSDEVKKAEDAQSSQHSTQTKLEFPVVRSADKASRLLALYAGSSSMPLLHVESNRFFKGLLAMVPKFKMPTRQALGQQIDSEVQYLQQTIATYLRESKYYYSFGVDISTTKGMMLSLVGITAHVFAANGSCVRAFGLELVELEERHTAEYVRRLFNATLDKLKLRESRTLRIVTDCGKNMINAFYEPYRVVDEEVDPEGDEIDFLARDDEEMELIAEGIEQEEPEDLAAAFDGVHNYHIKCGIHRLERALKAVRQIDALLEITSPFRGFTKKLQQESVPSISLLYSGIHGLLQKLELSKGVLAEICTSLQAELRSRFEDVLTSGDTGCDPIYLAAACLDPVAAQASQVLELNYQKVVTAIKEMARVLIDEYGVQGIEVEEVPSSSTCDDIFGFDLPVKMSRLDHSVGPDKLVLEIEEYRAMLGRPLKVTTAEYWKQNEHKLRYLTVIARNVLSVPAASSCVERLFSQTTLHSSGHKGNSKYKAIRRKALLSFNDSYIKI